MAKSGSQQKTKNIADIAPNNILQNYNLYLTKNLQEYDLQS